MFSVSCAVVVKKKPKPNTQKICQAKKSWSFYRVFFFFFTSKQRRVWRIWTVYDGELKQQSKGIKLIFTAQKCQFVM